MIIKGLKYYFLPVTEKELNRLRNVSVNSTQSIGSYLSKQGIYPGKYGDYQDYIEEKEKVIISSFKYKIRKYIKDKIFKYENLQ
jgi:hypothetical protein